MNDVAVEELCAERDRLLRENAELRQQMEEANYRVMVMRDIAGENNLLRCRAEAELAAARKVADAAVVFDVAHRAANKVGELQERRGGRLYRSAEDKSAMALLWDAERAAQSALADAVREYRARVEVPVKENNAKDD